MKRMNDQMDVPPAEIFTPPPFKPIIIELAMISGDCDRISRKGLARFSKRHIPRS